jgi:ABC-type glycerol-3-phosphate transport system substrate-binding protein
MCAGLIGATGLAGCGGSGGSENGNDANGGVTTPTEIGAWGWGNHAKHLKATAEKYNQENEPTVVAKQKSGFKELWTTGLRSRSNLASLAMIRSDSLEPAVRNDGVVEVHDTVVDYADGLWDVSKTRHTVDGRFHSFPNDLGPMILVYNKGLFADAGLPSEPSSVEQEMPTWKEYMQTAETIKSETGAEMHGFGINSVTNLYQLLRTQAGGGWYNDDGKFQFDQTANVEALRTFLELAEYGADVPLRNAKHWQAMKEGDIACLIAPAYYTAFLTSGVGDDGKGLFRYAKPPRFKEGRAFGSNRGGATAAIPFFKSERQQALAKDFANVWQFSETGVGAHMDAGMVPAYTPDESVFDRPVEYFGGQPIWQKIRASGENCPYQFRAPNIDVQDMIDGIVKQAANEPNKIDTMFERLNEKMVDTVSEEGMSVTIPDF